MRRRSWLMLALAAWVAFAMPARAQQAGTPFEPVTFVADPADRASGPERLALTSASAAELTFVRGAKPVQGTWSLVSGPRIRYVGPDATVRLFGVFDQEVDAAGDVRLECRSESAWLKAVASDPTRRSPPARAPVATTGAEVCFLERHAEGGADWTWQEGAVVSVLVGEKSPDTLVVGFPDGTSRTLARKGPGWQDTTPGVARAFDEKRARLVCARNLKQLADMFITLRSEKMGKPQYDGAALFLSWRTSKNPIREGEEAVLICPGDLQATNPNRADIQKAYDDIDLANPPPDKCSYAGRDFTSFPLSSESGTREPIACCRQGADGRTSHHKGGINVAFDDGSVAFLTTEDLGLAPGDPIVVGPDSKSPILRKLVYIKKR